MGEILRRAAALALMALACLAPAKAVLAEAVGPDIEVVVERPGPSMWRIAGAQGEVFILGVVQPLPQSLKWKSTEVDAVIARADRALVGRTQVSAGISDLLRNRDAFRNPDGGKVSDYLSETDRARFAKARANLGYPEDGLENWRPYVAAAMLTGRASERAGLSDKLDIEKDAVAKLRKRKIKPRSVLKIEAKPLIQSMKKMPAGADAKCMTIALDMVETKIPIVAARATAWARGDMAALRETAAALSGEDCLSVLQAGGVATDALVERAKADWVAALKEAARAKGVTFAIAPMGVLVTRDGVLDRLRAGGMTIEGP